MKPENSSNVGGAPGGLGGSTGVDPKAGGRRGSGEERSFEPGPDSPGGELAGTGGGADPTGGTGENAMGATGKAAGGDIHLGKDGQKLGDPMNARRQATSDENSDMSNGSGAD